MIKTLLRKVLGLALLGIGCYYLATGVFSALLLLLAPTESGVVVATSISPRPASTNCACVVWGVGLVMIPPLGDWEAIPKVGDHVAVLACNDGYSAGTLKSGRALRRVWLRAIRLTTVGGSLLAGYYVMKRRYL